MALPFDDSRWESLTGGYRTRYDPRPALERLSEDFADSDAWSALWEELHHQGDVGDASYASVPMLASLAAHARTRNWNLYALVATIEVERHRTSNPEVPAWLAGSYFHAWHQLVRLALSDLGRDADELLVRSAVAVVALGQGQLRLGALLASLDSSDTDGLLEDQLAWSELYDDARAAIPPLPTDGAG